MFMKHDPAISIRLLTSFKWPIWLETIYQSRKILVLYTSYPYVSCFFAGISGNDHSHCFGGVDFQTHFKSLFL